MNYHIDTGLIKEKFKVDCECPLCEIKQVVEEQFLHEFLNDAVMEDNTRIKVGKLGFCDKHYDMLFSRQNKLSVALQVRTRVEKLQAQFGEITSVKQGLKMVKDLEKASSTCIICDLVEESMTKYYKTIAQMYANERDFYKTLISTKGFCMHHYAELIKYSKCASVFAKDYLKNLSGVQMRNLERVENDLKKFCDKHDYRNANEPLGTAETALPRIRTKLYGKKYD